MLLRQPYHKSIIHKSGLAPVTSVGSGLSVWLVGKGQGTGAGAVE